MSGNTPPGGQPDPQQPYPYGSQPTGPGFGQPAGPGYGQGGYPQGPQNPYGAPPTGPGGPGQPMGPGGPGQPMGPGGPGQPMGPGGPYGAGPGGPYSGAPQYGAPPPGAKKSNRLWIIIGAAVLALIILGVGAGVLINNRGNSAGADPADPADPANPGTNAPVANKPSDAVKAYLEALAAGKADTALALGDTTAADKTFLTDAVLADSISRAPITDINVPEVTDEYTYNVDATYKMGEEAVSDQFSVKKVGDSWKVRESFVDLTLTSTRSATVPMLINKVPVKTDKIRVFPGSYSFATGNKYLDYGTSNTLLVKSLTAYPSMSDIELGVTDAGLKAFVASAKTQVQACVKQKKLAPSGCPFGIREASYQDIDEDTIEWKLDDDAFANVKPRLDYENPAVITYSGSIPVIFNAEGEQFDRKATFGPTKVSGYSKMSANMTKEPVKVVFTR